MKSLNRTYRVFALTMAFVMFATSVNLALDMHFCQGELKSVSILGKAKSCHEIMAAQARVCPHHQKMAEENLSCAETEKGCCNNKFVHIQSDFDQLNITTDFLVNLQLQWFVIAFTNTFFQDKFIEKNYSKYNQYQSPLISRDTYALFETFLI